MTYLAIQTNKEGDVERRAAAAHEIYIARTSRRVRDQEHASYRPKRGESVNGLAYLAKDVQAPREQSKGFASIRNCHNNDRLNAPDGPPLDAARFLSAATAGRIASSSAFSLSGHSS